MLSSPPPIPEAVPATDSPSHSLNIQNTTTPPEQSPVKSKRFTTFWVWFFSCCRWKYLCSTGSVFKS